MTPQQRIERAGRAQAILGDDLVEGAMRAIEARAIAAWKRSEPRDTEGREMAWLTVRAVELFRRQFSDWITDGKIAQRELSEV